MQTDLTQLAQGLAPFSPDRHALEDPATEAAFARLAADHPGGGQPLAMTADDWAHLADITARPYIPELHDDDEEEGAAPLVGDPRITAPLGGA
jgi:hypothetical protein